MAILVDKIIIVNMLYTLHSNMTYTQINSDTLKLHALFVQLCSSIHILYNLFIICDFQLGFVLISLVYVCTCFLVYAFYSLNIYSFSVYF